jgi:uncharacterized membrane protein
MKYRKGQIGVIMTFALATLLGAMVLGVDLSLMYFDWGLLQKAADAAALAGALELTGQPDATGTVANNAKAFAKGYACLNGINDPKNSNVTLCPKPSTNPDYVDKVVSVSVDPNDTKLSITLSRQIPYFFGRVIGLDKGSVGTARRRN